MRLSAPVRRCDYQIKSRLEGAIQNDVEGDDKESYRVLREDFMQNIARWHEKIHISDPH